MITSCRTADRRLAPLTLVLVLAAIPALSGCVTAGAGTRATGTQAAKSPEQLRLESAPAAEREALAAAHREAAAVAAAVQPARRLVERRTLEVRLAGEELDAARAFLKAARARAEIAQKFGAEAGLDRAPVLTLIQQAELAARQAEVRIKLAQARYDHAAAVVPVAEAQVEVARRKADVARERALAATRPGVESVAYPPLAEAQARLATAEARRARAEAAATRRLAEVEAAEYALGRLGTPVALTTAPGSGAWPALAAPRTAEAAAPATKPTPAALTAPAPVRAAPAGGATEAAGPGGSVTFEPAAPK